MDFYADRYPILRKFDEEIRRKVSMFFVYPDGKMAVVATNDDKVYVVTSRAHVLKQLGIEGVHTAQLIEVLSDKKVVNISGSYAKNSSYRKVEVTKVCLFVQTDTDLYRWNPSKKLNEENNPVFTVDPEGRINNVCVNDKGCIVLLDGGTIKHTSDLFGVGRIQNTLGHLPVVQVSIGETNGLARTSEGDVYTIKLSTYSISEEKMIKLDGKHVVNIACGRDHNLAVTEEGELFSWGDNQFGQTVYGAKSDNRIDDPIKLRIATNLGVAEVTAHYMLDVSVARTYENDIFIWGKIGQLEILSPMNTFCYSLDEAVAKFAEFTGTFNALKLPANIVQERPIAETVSLTFDDKNSGDFEFIVENKNIYVQKELLKMRSEHFRMMFNSDWKENENNKTEITQFSYEVYRAFLKYLYTGKVEISASSIWELFDLANSYHENDLKTTCAYILGKTVDVTNVIEMYKKGILYDSEVLKEASVRFTSTNFGKVMVCEDFLQLDSETQKVFLKHASGRIDHAISISQHKK